MNLKLNIFYICLAFLFSLNFACAQLVKCELTLEDKHLLKRGYERNFTDYLFRITDDKVHPFIGKNDDLEELTTWICTNNFHLSHSDSLFDTKIELQIFAAQRFDEKYLDSIYLIIGDQVTEITKDDIDILSPNFCETNLPVKPIKVFGSKDGRLIFIYVFGENKDSTTFEIKNSYLAKIIIKNGKLLDIIQVDSSILKAYGWLKCPQIYTFL